MPGMNRGGGGGQMMPGGGSNIGTPGSGPGGSAGPGDPLYGYNPRGAQANLGPGAARVASLQAQVWALQKKCAAGDGRACNDVRTVQQQLQMAQQKQQQAIGIQNMRGKGGSMGTNGRGGRGRTDPGEFAARLLDYTYGSGGGGGW